MRTKLAEANQDAPQASVKQFYAMQHADIHHIRTMIIFIHSDKKSWRKAGDYYGISGAMARLIANGYKPGKTICKRLGVVRYKPRPRRAINLDNPASAAETIKRHASQEFVAELIKLLNISDNKHK